MSAGTYQALLSIVSTDSGVATSAAGTSTGRSNASRSLGATSGDCTALAISAFRRKTMGCGNPGGPKKPNHAGGVAKPRYVDLRVASVTELPRHLFRHASRAAAPSAVSRPMTSTDGTSPTLRARRLECPVLRNAIGRRSIS